MTLFAMRDRDSVLAVRSPARAVGDAGGRKAFADERGRVYHRRWLQTYARKQLGLTGIRCSLFFRASVTRRIS